MSEAMLAPQDSFLALEALLETKRAAFKKKLVIALAIADYGACIFDLKREQIAERGWDDHADLSIVSNARTVSDLLLGRFNPEKPGQEHLFLWSGSDEDWRALSTALEGGKSMVDLRASAPKKMPKKRR